MKIRHFFLLLLLPAMTLSSCKKEETQTYDPQKQLEADEVIIKDFIAKNNIPAVRHETGVYYQIIEPGEGNITYRANTTVTANYTLRFLDGTVIQQSTEPFRSRLAPSNNQLGLITAWQIGIPLIQKGGKIRLISPSGYAYGPRGENPIPPNAVLDFDIELVDVQN